MASSRTVRTVRAREEFLRVFSETCNVSEACRAAGIGRTAAYVWRNDEPEFAADWHAAEETAIDSLEKAAWDRAKVDKSDRMLEILLKAHRPEKYVERVRAEHTGANGGPIEIEQITSDADAFTRTVTGLAARQRASRAARETEH